MKPYIIKNEEQYAAALAYVATLMNATAGSPQEAELELWGTLVELYEKDVHPIPLPDRARRRIEPLAAKTDNA